MRSILFTTHRLKDYAGSELVIFDLAKEFIENGFRVTIATFSFENPIKQLYEQENIDVINILDNDMTEEYYDFIWSQHAPVLYDIIYKFKIKYKYILFSSLSPFEPLETPPLFVNHLNLCLVNSCENRDELINIGVVNPDKIRVFVNSVPDNYYSNYDPQNSANLNKIAIISNHVPEELYAIMNSKRDTDISIEILGHKNNFIYVDSNVLKKYDAIITIGRTVQHSLAMGIPVYCYDHFGGPGWINRKTVNDAEYYNFSGRCSRIKRTHEQLYEDILNGFQEAFDDREYLQRIAKERYSLNTNLKKTLEQLEELSANSMDQVSYNYKLLGKHNQYYTRQLRENINLKNVNYENENLWERVNVAESSFNTSNETNKELWKRVNAAEIALNSTNETNQELWKRVNTAESEILRLEEKTRSIEKENQKLLSEILYYFKKKFWGGKS
jgi:hypothetical protein